MRGKLDSTVGLGMTPKLICKSTTIFSGENKIYSNDELKKNFDDKLIHYEKLPNEEYLFLKDTCNHTNQYKHSRNYYAIHYHLLEAEVINLDVLQHDFKKMFHDLLILK